MCTCVILCPHIFNDCLKIKNRTTAAYTKVFELLKNFYQCHIDLTIEFLSVSIVREIRAKFLQRSRKIRVKSGNEGSWRDRFVDRLFPIKSDSDGFFFAAAHEARPVDAGVVN